MISTVKFGDTLISYTKESPLNDDGRLYLAAMKMNKTDMAILPPRLTAAEIESAVTAKCGKAKFGALTRESLLDQIKSDIPPSYIERHMNRPRAEEVTEDEYRDALAQEQLRVLCKSYVEDDIRRGLLVPTLSQEFKDQFTITHFPEE